MEETPIFELTVTFDGYHKPVVYPLQDIKAIFHAYPSLEEPSEVFLDQNAANKYVRITSACVNAFEHIMHHYATEDGVPQPNVKRRRRAILRNILKKQM